MNRVSKKILDDAEDRVASIEEDLEKTVLRATSKHREEMEARMERRNSELNDLYLAELKRLKSLNELEIRKTLLGVRRSILDQVFDSVAEILRNDRDTRARYIREMAVCGVFTGDEEIIVAEADRELVDEAMLDEINRMAGEKLGTKAALRLSQDVLNSGEGLMLRSGAVVFNATFSAALAEIADENELDIIKMLFGDRGRGKGEKQ